MKKKMTFTITGFLILFLSIAVSRALIQSKPEPKKDGQRENLMTVKTSPVTYESLTTSFSYQGRLQALENISLSAEVNGKILQGDIPFKKGQNFRQGDLLIKIFDKNAEAGLKASRSNFLRTLSHILPDLKVDYPDSYQDWQTFFNSIDLGKPLPELPEAKNEKEKIFLASQNVLSEYYALKQQEITFEKYSITAPFNGYFKQVNREAGSIAANGAELAVIVRSDALEIEVPVFPADAKRITAGQTVQIHNNSGNISQGKISRIARFVDPSTQSVNVYVAYQQNKDTFLLEGEMATVHFENAETVQGMPIPREALIEDKYVYLVKEGLLAKYEVRIIQLMEDDIVISGLPEGATLVTESLVTAKAGQRVLTR